MHFKIIETERLLLKGLTPQDMSYIFENLDKAEIMTLLGHRSEEDYLKEFYKYKNGYASYNRSFLLFLMTDKNTDTIIGRCGLHNYNVDHKRAEIGYVMEDEQFRQKGLMSEAVRSIIRHGFTQMHLNRIEALVGNNNIPSLKIMEKFRFIKEGVLRNHFFQNDHYEDSIVFSKLYGEYMQERY